MFVESVCGETPNLEPKPGFYCRYFYSGSFFDLFLFSVTHLVNAADPSIVWSTPYITFVIVVFFFPISVTFPFLLLFAAFGAWEEKQKKQKKPSDYRSPDLPSYPMRLPI